MKGICSCGLVSPNHRLTCSKGITPKPQLHKLTTVSEDAADNLIKEISTKPLVSVNITYRFP